MDKLNKYLEEANVFFRDVAIELGNPQDTDHAFRVSVALFHTLRDRITTQESMHVISQLPMILKGLYVDGWKIHDEVDRTDTLHEFLDAVRSHSLRNAGRDFGNDQQAVDNLSAVIRVLRRYVSEGEMRHIRQQLPQPIAELFA
ncbi:MAG TPA: DUF2267 domain-containing protein [Chitinophagaceae bacterium]|nr:DUF2267 domain-containing protein [Chitinophagaceae bacterium]